MLYIRADGNAEIGTGHIMRCLSIAQAIQRSGQRCTFIVADRKMIPLLAEQSLPYVCLHTVWNDLDQETAQMEELIRKQSIKVLLVDSYFVTPDYLRRLDQLTHIAYIDDLNAFLYPCSTLINYNIYAQDWDYPSRYPATQLLLGPKYAPLRSEFQDMPERRLRSQVQDVLVSTGGSDAMNIAERFTEAAVKRFPRVRFHIVVGRFNPYRPQLEYLAQRRSNIMLHCNVQRMSDLMLVCDAAISAGGSTLYELCACGVPTVAYALADNQLPGAKAFERSGMMLYAGDVRENAAFAEIMCDRLAELIDDAPLRNRMSQQMQNAVDGTGAQYLADKLLSALIEGRSSRL